MSVGIISYLSQRGLGNMCADLRRQLGIKYQLVVPDEGWPMNQAWMNGEEFYLHEWEIQKEDLQAWRDTDGIDTLVSIETGFGRNTFRYAKELGIRTILIVMWEAFNPNMSAYQNVDLYVCPSFRCFQEVPFDNKIFLPYPVDTEEFKFKQRTGPAKVFIHNAGTGGMNGRKGTLETIKGFMKAKIAGMLVIRCQRPLQEICGIDGATLPDNIKVEYGNRPTRAELYEDGDVLIYPSRYDGHALVTLEAMAAGMPVITTDASPMNEFGAINDLVNVQERKAPSGLVNPHTLMHIVDTDDLAAKIATSASSVHVHHVSDRSWLGRDLIERRFSWDVLRPRWKEHLGL